MDPIMERTTRGRKKVTLTIEEGPEIEKRARKSDENGNGLGRVVTLTAALVAGYVVATKLVGKAKKTGADAIYVSESITINRPVNEIYRFWRNLSNLPRAMSHLESVEERPNKRSHWKAKGPAGSKIEWDAEILVDRENEIISWRSLEGAIVRNEGTVRFKDVGNGQRTEVKVSLTYHPPGGPLGATVAKLLGAEPAQQVAEDLRGLKKQLETGGPKGGTATNN